MRAESVAWTYRRYAGYLRNRKEAGWRRMSERRLRTAQRKKRARAKFWDSHGEKIRLALIAGGMVVAASLVARAALGG
jgi:hypothetical protein